MEGRQMSEQAVSKIVRITSNNQIAIPAFIVRSLNLRKGSYLEVKEQGRKIIITPKHLVDDEDIAMYDAVIKKGRSQFAKGETADWENYQIRLTKDAEKGILKISQSLPAIGRKIRQQIDQLRTHPHLGMKLQGATQETRRVRVGDYRIIYEVYEEHILVLVLYIGPRGGAY
jgi:mRNA interferase RelE/StbE